MHILTIFRCDLCGFEVSLRTNDDWDLFVETWHDGVSKHFCSVCKLIPKAQALISHDLEIKEAIGERFAESQQERINFATEFIC